MPLNLPLRLILQHRLSPNTRLSTIRYNDGMEPEPTAAGALLRQARKRASLSQVDLAARASVTQSVISAYESGQRQPSIPALARLVDAAGFELTLGLRQPPGRLRRLSGPVGRRVRRHRKDLVAAAAAHGISNLRVFGSVARGEDRPDSDVDLLADFPPGLSLFGLGRLEADLEAILRTRVQPDSRRRPQTGRPSTSRTRPDRAMSYREHQRLADIQAAIDAIRSHLQRGDLSDGLIFDAVRIRLLEIGEAVKALPDDLLATQPSIPWRQIARMRDHLAHRYFDTAHAILQATVDDDLPDLERAVKALQRSLPDGDPPEDTVIT